LKVSPPDKQGRSTVKTKTLLTCNNANVCDGEGWRSDYYVIRCMAPGYIRDGAAAPIAQPATYFDHVGEMLDAIWFGACARQVDEAWGG